MDDLADLAASLGECVAEGEGADLVDASIAAGSKLTSGAIEFAASALTPVAPIGNPQLPLAGLSEIPPNRKKPNGFPQR
jgi:hypothetical protein